MNQEAQNGNQEKVVEVVAGIDVGKAHLDVHIEPTGETRQFPNDAGGRRGLRTMLHKAGVELVVVEATGRYHRALHQSLHACGLPVAVVSPLRARRFAQAAGQMAKTDPLDASLLAWLGQVMAPEVTEPLGEEQLQLADLCRARAKLAADKAAYVNANREYEASEAVAVTAHMIGQFERQIARLEDAIRTLIANNPEFARRARILQSIKGFGAVTAAVLCAEIPELGTVDRHAAAALAGLAPYPDDSGKRKGQRYIKGGRMLPRNTLFMAATSAIKFNPDMKSFYDRLIGEGKAHKVALTAVMRKLVILANVLVRDDRNWTAIAPEPGVG